MFIYLVSALTPCIFVFELDYKSHMPMFRLHTNKNIIPCFRNEANMYLHISGLWIFFVLCFYEYGTFLSKYFQYIKSIFSNNIELIRYVIRISTSLIINFIIMHHPKTVTEAVIYNVHIMKHIFLTLRQEILCF